MTVYVSETDGVLRIVREGTEVRLPLADSPNHVTIPADAPSWAARIAREYGYTADEAPDADTPKPQMPTT